MFPSFDDAPVYDDGEQKRLSLLIVTRACPHFPRPYEKDLIRSK
jgi:hypothetical protein